jgi:hypothetical protein
MVCVIGLVASAFVAADQPNKPKKPPKPVEPTTELITFTGSLEGSAVVEDCCPNAGPFPEYAMTLNFEVDGNPAGTFYEGNLFINRYGVGRNQRYIVQFWNDEVAIQIIGGVINEDRKNKITTVTFTDDLCTDLDTGDPIAIVSFVLVRSP